MENGDTAKCVKLVVKYLPDNLEIGPFCPASEKRKRNSALSKLLITRRFIKYYSL